MITDLDRREYCFEKNKALLDADATAAELQEFNTNVREARSRGQDEDLYRTVRAACEKFDIKQNLNNPHTFAYRAHGRVYPTNLRLAAMQRLMDKYEQVD